MQDGEMEYLDLEEDNLEEVTKERMKKFGVLMQVLTSMDEDAKNELRLYLQARSMSIMLWDMREYLRSIWKYRELETEEATNLIDEIYDKYHELIRENNIDEDL